MDSRPRFDTGTFRIHRHGERIRSLLSKHVPPFVPWLIRFQGAFQDYYQSTLLPSSSPASISLIGSLQLFFLFAGSLPTGRIFDAYGTTVNIHHFPHHCQRRHRAD